MGMVAAICTQCGANIEIDESRESGVCQYCKTPFITEKLIYNYTYNINSLSGLNIHNATININGSPQEQERIPIKTRPEASGLVKITYPKYIKTQKFGLNWTVSVLSSHNKQEIARGRLGDTLTINVAGPTDIAISGGNAFGSAKATVRGGENFRVQLTALGTIKLVKISDDASF